MIVLLGFQPPVQSRISDITYKRLFTTLRIFIAMSTQSGLGTPLIFAVVFTHYITKRITEITSIAAFISGPP